MGGGAGRQRRQGQWEVGAWASAFAEPNEMPKGNKAHHYSHSVASELVVAKVKRFVFM